MKHRQGAGLKLRGIHRQFEGRPVINHLDLDVAPGEFLAIIGPSGCGKSTLLRLLAHLDQADQGTLDRSEADLDVAFVFQDPCLMPWRSVIDNVALPLELQGVPRHHRIPAAEALLRTVGLGDAQGKFPQQLSGGMKMRVSLARALITRPDLLLLDEPFAALDDITRHHLDDHLQSLWLSHPMTVVFVTHSLSEAVYLADRVIVLSAGGGNITLDYKVPLPHPRTAASRLSTPFIDHLRTVSEAFEGHSRTLA
ncbi:MAG: ABC transporter ATP-binding protein [Methylococcus sp.]|jgi:NitT/TauT family transport system ATP-binding protein|nr:MAG: ABC transporter ATP-binding protein [Methylococcus sp.]